tara:strand:- start:639 stop:2228 length:1590 start_codon:yes stop_codon:yes gene_type:complete
MYLSADLHATQQLYCKIKEQLDAEPTLWSTAHLTFELCLCLARIYQRGFAVNLDTLEEVRKEFEQEKQGLISSLQEQIIILMGDRPINLNSPEQLSWVVYSRRPLDKNFWAIEFGDRMPDSEFKSTVRSHSEILYKQKAVHCAECSGTGQVRKTRKNGTPFSNTNKCPRCSGGGYLFHDDTKRIAGLRFVAPNSKWVSANGFGTGKDNLQFLESIAISKDMHEAARFLKDVRRLSAVDTYLSSFVDGIVTHTKQDGKLHVRLLQHRTSTGRLSGADPNMQNMPRGNTFPVKKVFISRWHGGKVMEADFAQLEFRVAAFLSQDATAIREVSDGFDVHNYTASVISAAGQKTSRQDAKAHTFAPLYGASGFGRTKAEAAYYQQFTEKYSGIAAWHQRLAKEALNTGKITIPSGREYSFPDVTRRQHGGVTFFTQIKNYPVQGFATADIVPIALLHIDKLLDGMQSCVVNTVHDSIVIDIHPDEQEQVIAVINDTNLVLKTLVDEHWNIDFNVPLLLESKIGPNWLDTKDVA